jgi:transcriptional regulator with XRE-family HTH domain
MMKYNPNAIICLLHQNEITQSELARRLGISRQRVKSWIKTPVNIPSSEALMAVAKILKKPMSYFFTMEKKTKSCSIEGCDRKHAARGLCGYHYDKAKKNKEFSTKAIGVRTHCTIVGCDLRHYALGFCRNHWKLKNSYGSTDKRLHTCMATDCKQSTSSLFCCHHAEQYTRHVGIDGEHNPRWNGGVSEYPNHYKMKQLRKEILLERGETCQNCGEYGNEVHHRDGSKTEHFKENFLVLCHTCHMGVYHSGSEHRRKTLKPMIIDIVRELGLSYGTIRAYFTKPDSISHGNYIKIDLFFNREDKSNLRELYGKMWPVDEAHQIRKG